MSPLRRVIRGGHRSLNDGKVSKLRIRKRGVLRAGMHFGAKSTFAGNAISLGRKEVKTDDVVAAPPSLGCGLVELDRLRTQYCLKAGGVRWEEGLTPRQKLEFTGRVVRGIFGLILVLTAFFLALGA